jgi:hypothetical protein
MQLDKYMAAQHNAPVSTILLQENSFKPAHEAGFFLPAVPCCNPAHFFPLK